MKNLICLLLLINLCGQDLHSASKDSIREDLRELLENRRKLFDAYSGTLTKKSGIFNNKTKNDLRETHERLKKIVDVDNVIMSRLNNLVDYKNFEKQNMTYELGDYNARIENLENTVKVLSNTNQKLEEENRTLKTNKSGSKRFLYSLLILLAGIIFSVFYFRNKKKANKS